MDIQTEVVEKESVARERDAGIKGPARKAARFSEFLTAPFHFLEGQGGSEPRPIRMEESRPLADFQTRTRHNEVLTNALRLSEAIGMLRSEQLEPLLRTSGVSSHTQPQQLTADPSSLRHSSQFLGFDDSSSEDEDGDDSDQDATWLPQQVGSSDDDLSPDEEGVPHRSRRHRTAEEDADSEDEDAPQNKSDSAPEQSRYKWVKDIPPTTQRMGPENLVRRSSGLTRETEGAQSEVDFFNLFFTDEIVSKIVLHTNERLDRLFPAERRPPHTNMKELRALLGLILLQGYFKESSHSVNRLWSEEFGRQCYRVGMTSKRFKELLSALRFDDYATRELRRRTDKFAPIRDLWNLLNDRLKACYNPGSCLCIDEMLSLYRGRRSFRQYIKSKPGKYGLVIYMINDVDSKYVLGTHLYGGKSGNDLKGPTNIALDLVAPFALSNRNVTMDRHFTSVELAHKMSYLNLTLLGTIMSSRKHIPPEFKSDGKGTREKFSSTFAFLKDDSQEQKTDMQMTCVSYIPSVNPFRKCLLLSTMHHEATIPQTLKGEPNTKRKPAMVIDYNSTKRSVDDVVQMVRNRTTKRGSRRWTLAVFFSLVDVACLNASILYVKKHGLTTAENRNGKQRKHFIKNVWRSFVMDHIGESLTPAEIMNKGYNPIISLFPELRSLPEPLQPKTEERVKRRCKSCYQAAPKERKRAVTTSTRFCCHCKKYFCKIHRRDSTTSICHQCE